MTRSPRDASAPSASSGSTERFGLTWIREPLSEAARRRRRRTLLLSAGLGVALLLFPFSPLDGVVLCPFRRLLDARCPGCGMTRACLAALHGHWTTSFQHHPFGIPLLLGTVAVNLKAAGEWWLDRAIRLAGPWSELRELGYRVALALLLAFWLLRATGYAPWWS